MSAFVVPALHLMVLVALGALSRSRLAVLLAALAAALSVLLLAPAADFTSRPAADLAMDFAGVALGAVLGVGVAAGRARRGSRAPEPRGVALARARRRPRRGAWALAALGAVLAAGVGLYLEGGLVPGWRATVDGWRDSPAARAIGLAPAASDAPAGAAKAGAGSGAAKAGAASAGTKGGGADAAKGRSADAAKRAAADAPKAGATGIAKAGAAGAGAADGSRVRPAPARPQGDLRHCLDRTGDDLVRCAEQGR